MRPAELLLRHQALEQRARSASSEIARLEASLAGDVVVERSAGEVASIDEERQRLAPRLREAERQAQDHRARMRGRERELMSGRIRNPTELMTLSTEVEHMKSRVAAEEDVELGLMEEMEAVEARLAHAAARLAAAQAAFDAARPERESALERTRQELQTLEAEAAQILEQVPPAHRSEYRRLRMQPAVAEVRNGQCAACHVAVTSRGMQLLRRDEELVHCDNCGRLLVMA